MKSNIYMGRYYGKPIEWRIINELDGGILLITEKIIEAKAFNDEIKDTNWENSDIRKWLNTDFYCVSFSSEEKSKIISIKTEDNVYDNIFLLALSRETERFKDSNDRKAFATEHALNDTFLGASYAEAHQDTTHWWWLRSISTGPYYAGNIAANAIKEKSSRAIVVSKDGTIAVGGLDVNYQDVGVRPAMWIKANNIQMI